MLISAGSYKPLEACFPDKGIKTAIISGKIKVKSTSKSKKLDGFQEIEYNREGQPALITNTKEETVHRREYEEGKLKCIITTRKSSPSFTYKGQPDSEIENSAIEVDTAVILSHNEDGRPLEMKDPGGMKWIFEYQGCESEMITTLYPNGDTLQQIQNISKNGVLVESITNPSGPVEGNFTRTFYGYKFNKAGHWIERAYEVRDGEITEKRKLTYY